MPEVFSVIDPYVYVHTPARQWFRIHKIVTCPASPLTMSVSMTLRRTQGRN